MPFSRNLVNLRIEPVSLISPALAGRFFSTSTICKTPEQRTPKTQQQKMFRISHDLIDISPKDIQTANSYTTRCSTSLATREIQIKPQ